MLIAKLLNAKGVASFHQIVKTGPVGFDPRPDWMLLATPPGVLPRKQELKWVHSADREVAWVRRFRFAGTALAADKE